MVNARLFFPNLESLAITTTSPALWPQITENGERPSEARFMRREHVKDGWWEMPGEPVKSLGWPGTKNGRSHRVWVPKAALALIETAGEGFLLPGARGGPLSRTLDQVMRDICTELKLAAKVTPHDLRRTHGTTITGLGFGRDPTNRIQNHKDIGIDGAPRPVFARGRVVAQVLGC
jgi:integrase